MSNADQYDDGAMRDAVVRSHKIAIDHNHEYVTIEHILYACLEDEFIHKMLDDSGIPYNEIIHELDDYFESGNIPVQVGARPRQTSVSISILQGAIKYILSSGRNKFELYDIILSILEKSETHAAYILMKYGVTPLLVKEYVTYNKHGDLTMQDGSKAKVTLKPKKNQGKVNVSQAKEILAQYTTNLNEMARTGKIDKLIGRSKEIFTISKILCRRTKNNILIVGEPGVGKTAIAEGLAYKIINNEVSDALNNAVVYSLEVGTIMAGTKYRGDLEERLQGIIQSVITISEEENIKAVLFIDEIHMMVGAGGGSDAKAMDIANLIKPALAKGSLRVIGSTTYAEYRKYFEKDGALLRRFQRLDVTEPSIDEAIEIIKGLRQYYEEFHGVSYTDEAVENAVRLSAKFINKSHLPDKAIDVIDSAGAKNKVIDKLDQVTVLDINHIMDEVASIANIPINKLRDDDNAIIENLEPQLKSMIFGQDLAIEDITSSVFVVRAGLREPDKPEGCFLFNGPTGVGKTELAKQLAKSLNMNFARLDMSEFMEEHSVSKLIGSPPGYVGYEENGGRLINIVDEHPNSIILFDEIEKAHPKVFNILLQILDYGRLSNSHDKEGDFRNCIIILTGNIGSAAAERMVIGFGDRDNSETQNEEVSKTFPPEFRNRLDAVITFNKLDKETSKLILNKFINELNIQLISKNVVLTLTESAENELLRAGFDDKMGARPLARIIQQKIKKPLAPKILFGDLKNGGKVELDFKEDFVFNLVQDLITDEREIQ